MPDPLKALTSKFDKANARRHRLTGEPIIPQMPAPAGTHIVCLDCAGSYAGDDLRTTCPFCGGVLVEAAC